MGSNTIFITISILTLNSVLFGVEEADAAAAAVAVAVAFFLLWNNNKLKNAASTQKNSLFVAPKVELLM